MRRPPRKLTLDEVSMIWDRLATGERAHTIAPSMGTCTMVIHNMVARTGGMRPRLRHRAVRNLSTDEREEISRGLAEGRSLRAIAADLCRAPSTVSREVTHN